MFKIRLANVMGMDIDNAQHGIGIIDALEGIEKPEEFIDYCRKSKESIEYSNRIEKLDMLATRYKRDFNGVPVDLLEKFCKILELKFKNAIVVLRDSEPELSGNLQRLNADGHQYFTEKEIELLNYTGGLNRLITLYEFGSLYDALYNASVKKTITKNNSARLTNGQKKVSGLLEKTL